MKKSSLLFLAMALLLLGTSALARDYKILKKNCFAKAYSGLILKLQAKLEDRTMGKLHDKYENYIDRIESSDLREDLKDRKLKAAAIRKEKAFEKGRFVLDKSICEEIEPLDFSGEAMMVQGEFEACLNYRSSEQKDYNKAAEAIKESVFEFTEKIEKVRSSCADRLLDTAAEARIEIFHRDPVYSCEKFVKMLNLQVKECRNGL